MEEENTLKDLIPDNLEVNESSKIILKSPVDESQSENSEERLRKKLSINYLENVSNSSSDNISKSQDFQKGRKNFKRIRESTNKIDNEILTEPVPKKIKRRQTKKKIQKNKEVECSEEKPVEGVDNSKMKEETEENNVRDETKKPKIPRKKALNKEVKGEIAINDINEESNDPIKVNEGETSPHQKMINRLHNKESDCYVEVLESSMSNTKLEIIEIENLEKEMTVKNYEERNGIAKKNMDIEKLLPYGEFIETISDVAIKKRRGRPKKYNELYNTVSVIKRNSIDRQSRINSVTIEQESASDNGVIYAMKVKRSVGRPRKDYSLMNKGSNHSSLKDGTAEEECLVNNDIEGFNFGKRFKKARLNHLLNVGEDLFNDERFNKIKYKKVLGRPRNSLSLKKVGKYLRGPLKRRGRPPRIVIEKEEVPSEISIKSVDKATKRRSQLSFNSKSKEVMDYNNITQKVKRRSKKSLQLYNNDDIKDQFDDCSIKKVTEEILRSSKRVPKMTSKLLKGFINKSPKKHIKLRKKTPQMSSAVKFIKANTALISNHKVTLSSKKPIVEEERNNVMNLMNAEARRASLDKLANLEALLSKLEEEHENTKKLLRMTEMKLGENAE